MEYEDANRTPPRDINQRPNQVRRRIAKPFNNQLSNHVIFTNNSITKISLSILELEKAIHSKLNFKYIDLQLIRLIKPNQEAANVY